MLNFSRRRFFGLAAGGSLSLAGRASAAAGAIDESGFVRIGGIDQWIAIQGQNIRNPIILYLHGGPGEAQSPFLKEFLPWEQDFTVVNWDQRGAGKTYGRNGPSTPDMTLDRLVDDAIEIAQHVCARLSQRKVILVGQSWGSYLGVHVVKRRPDLFHAFVGTGQLASYAATIASQVQWARQQAAAQGDQETVKVLDEAAANPALRKTAAVSGAIRKWLMLPQDSTYAQMIHAFMGPKPYPAQGDVADWIAGPEFTSRTLGPALHDLDLRKLGPDMPLPFFVIQGRDDHIVSFEDARAYVEELRAPNKAFVPIDGGHYACFTNAQAFVATLRKYVRPLVM
jgi:pimeloyl-ACP methyl ester carboxylesterase